MNKSFLNFSVLQTVTFRHEDLLPGENFDDKLKAMLPDIWKSVSATIASAGGYKVKPLLDVDLSSAALKTTHHRRQSIGFSVEKHIDMLMNDLVTIYVYNAITPIHVVVKELELVKTRPPTIEVPVVVSSLRQPLDGILACGINMHQQFELRRKVEVNLDTIKTVYSK